MNQSVMSDDEIVAQFEENGWDDLIEPWLELLDREPESEWLKLATEFMKRKRTGMTPVAVELKDHVFFWTFEEDK